MEPNKPQWERIKHLMTDGQWRTIAEIAEAIGEHATQTGVSARLRELRRKHNCIVEKRLRQEFDGCCPEARVKVMEFRVVYNGT